MDFQEEFVQHVVRRLQPERPAIVIFRVGATLAEQNRPPLQPDQRAFISLHHRVFP